MTDTARRARRLRRGELALHALGRYRGNVKEAAADQGIAERTLRERVADYCRMMGFLTPFEAAYRTLPAEKDSQNGSARP